MIFSTDCSQSMGLQSVLKIRVKTSKLFALRASPYKGSKPRVNLDLFGFSTEGKPIQIGYVDRISRETLEKRLEEMPSNARCFAQGSSLMC